MSNNDTNHRNLNYATSATNVKNSFVTKKNKDRQCTYNVTLRRVHTTVVVVEKQ